MKFKKGDIVVINRDSANLPKEVEAVYLPQKRTITGVFYSERDGHYHYSLGTNCRGLDLTALTFHENDLKYYEMKLHTVRLKKEKGNFISPGSYKLRNKKNYRKYNGGEKVMLGGSMRHGVLKGIAGSWLGKRGYTDISFEERIERQNNGNKPRHYWLDVVGRKCDEVLVIECGGNNEDKLNALGQIFESVWVLPYGETEPYRWEVGTKLCHACGKAIAEYSQVS